MWPQVIATDSEGRVETSPWTYNWTVDTTPPVTLVNLTSANLTNAQLATFSAACGGEAFPELCMFCWRLSLSMDRTECTANTSITIPVVYNGDITAYFRAKDGAGNKPQNEVPLTWTEDTIPPETSASILSRTIYVKVLGASVINTQFLTLNVTANKPVRGFNVFTYSTQTPTNNRCVAVADVESVSPISVSHF